MLVGKEGTGLGLMMLLPIVFLLATTTHAQYTLHEIALHSSNDDCWTAVYDEVFDISVYAPSHPNPSVYAMCGRESTDMFNGAHGEYVISLCD